MPPRSRVPDAARLLELIDGFAEQPVLVLGDLVADRFIRGTPKRISREAPVLILRHDGEELVPGGGGNAVANMHALGGRPLPVGFVGDDEAGRALLDLFASRGIPIDGILVRRGYRTACKTRVLAGGKSRHQAADRPLRHRGPAAARGRRARRARAPPVRALDRVAASSCSRTTASAPPIRPWRWRSPARDGLVRIADSRYRLGDLRGLDGATPNEEEARGARGQSDEARSSSAGERAARRASAPASSCSRAAATA